jgi:hypothetical protein
MNFGLLFFYIPRIFLFSDELEKHEIPCVLEDEFFLCICLIFINLHSYNKSFKGHPSES